jgi:hypothetical protein
MLRSEIREGNTIVTSPDRKKGITITGVVTSTRGTVRCRVLDADGKDWGVPYEMIIACSNDVKPVTVVAPVKAKRGDVILTKQGEKYRIEKVNTSRYTATRISDGKGYYVPFHNVVEILDEKKSKREAQKAFLVGKGFTAKDVAEFEALFNN